LAGGLAPGPSRPAAGVEVREGLRGVLLQATRAHAVGTSTAHVQADRSIRCMA
jgi:hypothetical protein